MSDWEELKSETVAGKKVRIWKDKNGGNRRRHDYQVSVPIGLGLKEDYWIEADNKDEVVDNLRNGGIFEDEYGGLFELENPVTESTFNVEFVG